MPDNIIHIDYFLATCPIPLSPDGGEVSVQTDGAVTTANYICADKYTLYGEKTRTCLDDNTWEFEMPACSKYLQLKKMLFSVLLLNNLI